MRRLSLLFVFLFLCTLPVAAQQNVDGVVDCAESATDQAGEIVTDSRSWFARSIAGELILGYVGDDLARLGATIGEWEQAGDEMIGGMTDSVASKLREWDQALGEKMMDPTAYEQTDTGVKVTGDFVFAQLTQAGWYQFMSTYLIDSAAEGLPVPSFSDQMTALGSSTIEVSCSDDSITMYYGDNPYPVLMQEDRWYLDADRRTSQQPIPSNVVSVAQAWALDARAHCP